MKFESQTGSITDKDQYIVELEERLQEHRRQSELLLDAEQRLSDVPELRLRIADLEFDLAQTRRDLQAARREIWELDQMLMYGRRILAYIRPLIGPLRQARKRLRR